MARYIDVDIALDKMKNWHTQERLMDCIRDQPTADVAEVVRCKNCKNYELMKSNNSHFCNEFGGRVTEDDFCSRGARMDGKVCDDK